MSQSRSSVVHWLWNHNPFYFISALLMLYGVQASYGKLNIGTINCWWMMIVLGSYTVLLAIIGVLIVRQGKVWDDARSILLVLLLLFLSVSVCADDLFVKLESTRTGALLMIGGFGFSVLVLLGVLYGAGIRLKLIYLVPLILFLALFFVAPWWCSPGLHPTSNLKMEWALFLFPQVSAALMLTLIPAVRMRERSVEGNGTPWPWPYFPWSAFVFIGVAVVLRSYALAMTFGQSGPIWSLPDDRLGIVFDTVWRPFFLVPFALSILILLLEAGLVTQNAVLLNRVMKFAPALLVLNWPSGDSEATFQFLNSLTNMLGSPLWLSTLLLIGFYLLATLRKVSGAPNRLLASILILSVVGPRTSGLETMIAFNPLPIFAVGLGMAVLALVQRSTKVAVASTGILTIGLWAILPTAYRTPVCYHALLTTWILISLIGRDLLASFLQLVCSTLIVFSVLAILNGPWVNQISWEWRIAYCLAVLVVTFPVARFSRSGFYWISVVGTIGLVGEAFAVEAYRSARDLLGRNAIVAFSWSGGTLLIGLLISAYKARWLPRLGLYDWFTEPPLAASHAHEQNENLTESTDS